MYNARCSKCVSLPVGPQDFGYRGEKVYVSLNCRDLQSPVTTNTLDSLDFGGTLSMAVRPEGLLFSTEHVKG